MRISTRRIRSGVSNAVRSVKNGVGNAANVVGRLRRAVADDAKDVVEKATAAMAPESAPDVLPATDSVAAHLAEVTEAANQRRNSVRFDGRPSHGDRFDDPRGRVTR